MKAQATGDPTRAGLLQPSRWAALRERTQHLPRDTRDTLFQLAVIGWTIAPHLLHLPLWCGPMVLVLLVWRARLAWVSGALPGRWVVTAVLALGIGLTLWGEHTLLGKEAGVTLLVILMSLKTLELRAKRDALVVFFLGFFLVLTHFFYSQNLGTGLWLVAAVWGLLTALVLAHMPVGRPSLKRAGAVAARATLLGMPVMLVLFMLFPRLGPLWGLPQDAQGRTGLSGSLRLGGVASVAEDDSIALRIRFTGAPPPAHQLYFRGPVLSTFDGREWTRLVPNYPASQRPRLNLQLQGEPLVYEITLEPNQMPVLPLLEMTADSATALAAGLSSGVGSGAGPDTITPQVSGWLLALRPDGQWQSDRPISERLRVQGSAWLQHRHGPGQPVPGLRDLIDLPTSTNPRTLQWAVERRAQLLPEAANPVIEQTTAQQAQLLSTAVLRHITEGGYTYTLEPGRYDGDAIDDFWFDRKLGFCEHFASAYVVVMRAMGVPARVVTGYQGADPEPQDGYYIVRQRNAHAWAEYWQAGTGWVRVDPTAAVAPDRVSTGRSLRPPPSLVGGAINRINPALAAQVRATWERANNRWNQWVLNYSRGQQTDLLKALGFQAPSWQDLASLMILLLCSAALAGASWAWWDRRRQDPWQRLQQRVAHSLAGLGVTVQPHHAPRARAACVRAQLGLRGEALASQLDSLDSRRYGGTAPLATAALVPWWRTFAATARATTPVQPNATKARA